jgi:hypothetical protein
VELIYECTEIKLKISFHSGKYNFRKHETYNFGIGILFATASFSQSVVNGMKIENCQNTNWVMPCTFLQIPRKRNLDCFFAWFGEKDGYRKVKIHGL